jgi:hypothetical protein
MKVYRILSNLKIINYIEVKNMNTIINDVHKKIIYNYYLNHYKDNNIANMEYKKLEYVLNNNKNFKLISFGNIVFLLKIENDDVEFHSMGKEDSVFAFVKDVHKLINYVKQMNVKSISSYSNDVVFKKVVKRLNLNIKNELNAGPDGTTYNYYKLEF